MVTLLFIIGTLIMLLGLAGCILPMLPGPPLCFSALLIQQLATPPPFSAQFLWIWAVVVILVSAFDFLIPLYGTKKFGGSKYGLWGCMIGLIAGLFIGPLGILVGPFVGAFLGEMLANKESSEAFRSAVGSFVGFLFGTLLKLVVSTTMAWHFFAYGFDLIL